jgi:uncharacterized protein (DUF849 family)
MPGTLLITVAPTGAETAKQDCPQLPTTLEELVETAKRCEAAGAGMIHVHIRDDAHKPTLDLGRLTATVDALHRLLDTYGLPYGGRVHCDLVMGVPGGMPGSADALVAAVQALPSQVTSWSATGIGRSTLPVALASLSKGGHLRVGMEDVLTLAKGVPVEHNEQLVERAVAMGALAQRTPMTPAEARVLLQVRPS